MAATLQQLQAFESTILAAIANPTAEIWYDNFHKKSRPVGELQSALAEVRREMAAMTPGSRNKRLLPRAYCDL